LNGNRKKNLKGWEKPDRAIETPPKRENRHKEQRKRKEKSYEVKPLKKLVSTWWGGCGGFSCGLFPPPLLGRKGAKLWGSERRGGWGVSELGKKKGRVTN